MVAPLLSCGIFGNPGARLTKKFQSALSHKILNPFTVKYAFYWLLLFFVIYDILELWRHTP